ncbi:MAG: polysaccharide biosynthesis C-terminal domain-containing protein [Acidobacteria bacterium]|nr:polysaccharide biosynthesis C-terminal domain-containing protein [Acidobacteriota bacterium]
MHPDAAPAAPADAVIVEPRRLPTVLLTSMTLRFGTIALNAVTGIVTARALHPAGRGELAAMILWPMLFAGLTTMGLPSALVYYLRREPERAAAFIGWALVLCTAASIAGTAVGWFIVPPWLGHHAPEVIRAAQLCLLTTLLCSLTLAGRAVWEARGWFTWSSVSQVITPLMVVIGLAVLIWRGALTPVTAAAVYVLAGLPSLLWILTSIVLTCRPSLAGDWPLRQRLAHYGVRSYGVDLCGILAIYLDQALVVGLLSSASMGIYAVALSLSRVIGAIHASVAMIVFPRAVGLAPEAMVTAVARSARMGTLASTATGLVVMAAGPMLLPWLYGASYAAAVVLLPILLAEAVMAGLAQVLLQGFLAAGRPGVATLVLGGSLACSIPLFLVLVPAFGVAGAAFALLGGSSLRVLFIILAYRRMLGLTPPRVWISGADFMDLARYRAAVLGSATRLRAAGEAD